MLLWIDLGYNFSGINSKSSRKFNIRLTTRAHPWGFRENDCQVLNTDEKRKAIKLILNKESIDENDEVSLSQSFPIKADYPIPLFYFVEYLLSKDVSILKSRIDDYALNIPFLQKKYKNEDISNLLTFYTNDLLTNVNDYCVPVIKYYFETKNDLTDIEILFERIGSKGTPITKEDLMYSSIKAYWPENIKNTIDSLAKSIMPPVSLMLLSFRLAITNKNGLAKQPDINQIREIGREGEGNDVYDSICSLFSSKDSPAPIESIINIVKEWIGNDTPPYLLVSIARKSPDIFLFLMCLAQTVVCAHKEIEPETIRAIAFYFHWFVDDKEKWINQLYQRITNSSINLSEGAKEIILQAISESKAKPLIKKTVFDEIEISGNSNWRLSNYSEEDWWPLWECFWNNKEILLYTQRNYMVNHFKSYNPALPDMWQDSSCPWDYDHIVPKKWFHNNYERYKKYSEYCEQWKDCIGNLAAIPFQINRSLRDKLDWSYYYNNKEDLLICTEDYNKLKKTIQSEEKEALLLSTITWDRAKRIYEELYDFLRDLDLSELSLDALNIIPQNNRRINDIIKRKDIFKQLMEKNSTKQCSTYFLHNRKNLEKATSSCFDKAIEWAQEWMSCGYSVNNCFIAVTNCLSNSYEYEIGLRKMPDNKDLIKLDIKQEYLDSFNQNNNYRFIIETNNNWWNLWMTITPKGTEVVEKLSIILNDLYDFFNEGIHSGNILPTIPVPALV